mgnify:CR=1 FL=1
MKISAEVVADSIHDGKRITSLQLTMPRFILAQFNTHRAFSRSTASNRAIPTATLIEQVRNNPVRPFHWGMNQPGMQAGAEVLAETKARAQKVWGVAAQEAANFAQNLLDLGVHKQVANRILEPFMWAHTIVTATEWDNFFKLRLDDDAQPEIQELARCMKLAMDNSEPEETEFHLPYIPRIEMLDWVNDNYPGHSTVEWFDEMYNHFADVSAARCARVSYLNHDQSQPDKVRDLALAFKLIEANHWSPFEHQARSIDPSERSRNFIGWQQHRSHYEQEEA